MNLPRLFRRSRAPEPVPTPTPAEAAKREIDDLIDDILARHDEHELREAEARIAAHDVRLNTGGQL